MRPGLKLVTAPAAEPITTTQAKAFLRVDTSDEDTLVDACILSARKFVENYTGLALITQTWDQWHDRLPGSRASGSEMPWWSGTRQGAISGFDSESDEGDPRRLVLMRSPLISITHLKTYAEDDTESTLSAANYIVDDAYEYPALVLRDGVVWPASLRPAKAAVVRMVVGYGPAGTDVPGDILMAIRQLVAHGFENREPVSESAEALVPLTAVRLLDPYRRRDF